MRIHLRELIANASADRRSPLLQVVPTKRGGGTRLARDESPECGPRAVRPAWSALPRAHGPPVSSCGVSVLALGELRPRPCASGRRGGAGVAPELEQVVGGGDQAPFRATGGSAAALEAVDAAVEFGVCEDRFDHLGALAVDLRAGLGRSP